jgi:hypothetical protein
MGSDDLRARTSASLFSAPENKVEVIVLGSEPKIFGVEATYRPLRLQ